jgi:hypothetical protein
LNLYMGLHKLESTDMVVIGFKSLWENLDV